MSGEGGHGGPPDPPAAAETRPLARLQDALAAAHAAIADLAVAASQQSRADAALAAENAALRELLAGRGTPVPPPEEG